MTDEQSAITRSRVCVVVVGDIGRSPRMQNHAKSLANNGYLVDFVGYAETQPRQELVEDIKISFRYMEDVPLFTEYVPRLMAYAMKVLWQACALLFTLISLPKPDAVLVQTPPALPAMSVLCVYTFFRSCQLVVDWHNFGHSILALKLGHNHAAVRFYQWFEMFFGKRGDRHICVSKAMQADLAANNKISAVYFPDRPPTHFKPIDIQQKHELFMKLSREYKCFSGDSDTTTAFTEVLESGKASLRNNRSILLISSTSWTEDEDISVLFTALEIYDNAIRNSVKKLPNVICVITGKGPLKEHYAKKVSVMKFQHIKVCLPWLSPEDYPKLLAAADLGISLHASSSGLDLPMKVVDMFGCGLPVLALHFNCIDELVVHGHNGFVFRDKEELANQLQVLFERFPDTPQIEEFRHNLRDFQQDGWEENWDKRIKPLFPQIEDETKLN